MVAGFRVAAPDDVVCMQGAVGEGGEGAHGVLGDLFRAFRIPGQCVNRAVFRVVIVAQSYLFTLPDAVGDTQDVIDDVGKFSIEARHIARGAGGGSTVVVVVHRLFSLADSSVEVVCRLFDLHSKSKIVP